MASLDMWLQWFGLAIWLTVCAVVVYSYVRGLRRIQVQASGRTTALLRSPWLMLPLLAAYLAVLVFLWKPIFPGLSTTARLATALAGTLLTVGGAAFILWGRFTLGAMHNISSVSGVKLFANHRLITAGPFKIVRHPMYLGFALAVCGALLLYRTWAIVFLAVHGLVFVARARREEEALATTFGEEWRQYCRQVPAILPRLRGTTRSGNMPGLLLCLWFATLACLAAGCDAGSGATAEEAVRKMLASSADTAARQIAGTRAVPGGTIVLFHGIVPSWNAADRVPSFDLGYAFAELRSGRWHTRSGASGSFTPGEGWPVLCVAAKLPGLERVDQPSPLLLFGQVLDPAITAIRSRLFGWDHGGRGTHRPHVCHSGNRLGNSLSTALPR